MQQYVFDKLNVKFSKYNSENKNVTELWTPMDNIPGWCFIHLLEELFKKRFGLATGTIIILKITYSGACLTTSSNFT